MARLTIQQAFNLAYQHHRAGRLHEAENLYRHILTHHPEHADAMHNLGLIAHQLGHYDIAADLIRRAISFKSNWPQAYSNLGNALKDAGRLDEAIAACRQAISLKPNWPEVHCNLGNALRANGQFDQAIAAYRQATVLNPNLAEAHSNLGNVLKDMGQLDDAIAAYRQSIVLNPNLAGVHSNLGSAMKDDGRLDESIAACRRAISLQPGYAEAHGNLGEALRDKGLVDDAIAAYHRAIVLNPNLAGVRSNLGNALKDNGQLDEALAAYRQAVALAPADARLDSNLVFSLLYHPGYSAHSIAEQFHRWNRQHAVPLAKFIQPHGNDTNPGRRLRVGYVSADFKVHASANFLVPLMEHHDSQQVEIFCYAEVPHIDQMTRRLQQRSAHWRSTVGMSDAALAERIREDGIDVLVDLKMHTGNNRLLVFARKPAPVQVSWLAYPGSTGLTAIDYRLSDPYLDPEGIDESIYSERTIRLPDSFWCYDPLDGRDIPVNSLPALGHGVVTFGCLNNFCKINDDVLVLWADVLRQVKNSRLLMLAPMGSHRQRATQCLEQMGIDPLRIEFIAHQTRQQYLRTYQRIDLALDTFPYNGHTTSLDSFWMGVPVVTLIGNTAVARAGWCQLSNLGLTELAGETPQQFVQIAVQLTKDLHRLEQLRSTLRRRMELSPLMDAARFARNIEAAYRQMWLRWCSLSRSPGSAEA